MLLSRVSCSLGRRCVSTFRCSESNPLKHNKSHLGRFYIVPQSSPLLSMGESHYSNTLFSPEMMEFSSAVNEHAVLIREPALEVIHYSNQLLRNKSPFPVSKFVLYGSPGTGKTCTLGHLTHYASQSDAILLNFSRIKRWLNKCWELAPSVYKEGRLDHVTLAQVLLQGFLQTNQDKIKDLKCHREYHWSAREITAEGAPLIDVVNQGIVRPTFASDSLNVLMRELKLHCNENNCKLILVIDGVNLMFNDMTYIHREKLDGSRMHYYHDRRYMCHPNELSVIWNLKKMLRSDYNNAIIFSSIDRREVIQLKVTRRNWWKNRQVRMVPETESDQPYALLKEEGWEALGAFVPIHVKNYSRDELDQIIDYTVERKYIDEKGQSDIGRAEINFLTGKNPGDFLKYSHLM